MEIVASRAERQVSVFYSVPHLKILTQLFVYNFSYQAEVNRSMGVYRQKYEDWFNQLSETDRKAETARMNSSKTMRKAPVTKVAGATPVTTEPKIVNVPSNVTPAGPPSVLPT